MAPEMLTTAESQELIELGRKIREYQESKRMGDDKFLKKYTSLGSDRTYKRVRTGDLAELKLETQLTNYRTVWALIEATRGSAEDRYEELYKDFTSTLLVKQAMIPVLEQTGNTRFLAVLGDTGLGKTKAVKLLAEEYGQRFLITEAEDLWKDNPNCFLSAILKQFGENDQPTSAFEKSVMVKEKLCKTRTCVVVEEAHHFGPHCLNTIKSLINTTPGEFLITAMPSLWARLQSKAYQEVRQLTGNRFADLVQLEMYPSDIQLMIEKRTKGISGGKGEMELAVQHAYNRARPENMGNYGFVRDAIDKAITRFDDKPMTLDQWVGVLVNETERRTVKRRAA